MVRDGGSMIRHVYQVESADLSHTGRIRMFKQASQDLFDAYLEQLAGRATGATPQ